ncbi:similar to Saccharomyces cerevisiae YLR040C Putative protein of unknown function [Maudiozyma barnettii]|uniref:FAS1 domain-containing protein n=1 Tax=Maudiozyma barnettii TaxID=61262 RepID=A0A8H2ZK18_9SACH|nr:Afb1p [Kazachstania barnettii]CAB4257102.1 similar to Saccharomyces cerevisiae YLR040C Putative protein of unknown function [Kazachstania barnettii]CAD1779472.1 similar to Saccharomyces cerevisiae YLR040C Putative protein of unknown function [Kazachstania barnettii]
MISSTLCSTGLLLLLAVTTLINHSNAASVADQYLYRSMAEDKDFNFFIAFLNDFDKNYPSYTSYMIEHHLKLPQEVADYYNHLAKLPSTVDLENDIINSFPYTQFQTFVTHFPWYTSLLKDGHITTMYLPRDFDSMGTEDDLETSVDPLTTTNSTGAQNSMNGTTTSIYGSGSSTNTKSTKTSKSSKNGMPGTNTMSLSTPLYLLVIGMGMLL